MTFHIFVKIGSGSSAKYIVLNVNSKDTIHAVKQQIYNKEGIPPEFQVLEIFGLISQDNRSLSDYNVHAQSTLTLKVKGDEKSNVFTMYVSLFTQHYCHAYRILPTVHKR